jgi:hypothetical protein
MGCFLFACIPYIFVYTGERGELIDYRKSPAKDDRKNNNDENSFE